MNKAVLIYVYRLLLVNVSQDIVNAGVQVCSGIKNGDQFHPAAFGSASKIYNTFRNMFGPRDKMPLYKEMTFCNSLPCSCWPSESEMRPGFEIKHDR